MPRRRMTGAEEGNVELGADSIGGGPDAGGGRGAGMPRGKGTMPSPSPRLLSAESRLAQEKTWLKTLPVYCHAEPMRCSDFVWFFRVSGLDGTPYEEIGKVSFRAHFPRDYPRTPPTLLLTDELIHPNWKFPARGLEIPDLTKEGWNPSTTIPKILMYLREIIQRPDISALGLLWREGSGPLVDGGASLGHAAPSLATTATGKASSSSSAAAASALANDEAGAQHWTSLSRAASAPARDESGDVEGASAGGVRANATGGAGVSAWTSSGVSRGGTAATTMATAAGWTAARRDIDSELALLYLLDTGAFRNLVLKHQHHKGTPATTTTTSTAAAATASATSGASVASTATASSLHPTGAGGGVSGGTNGVVGGSNGRASLEGGPGVVGGSGGAASGAGGGVGKSFGTRRMKSVGALHGLGSFARKVTGGSSRGGSYARRSGNIANAESALSDVGESSRSGSKGCGGSTGGCGELSVGKMAELRQQQQRLAAGEGAGFSALMVSSPVPASRQESLSRTGSWDPGDNGGQEFGDSIPAAVNYKARKVLGLPQHRRNAGAVPSRSASSTSSSTTSSASSATSSSSTTFSFSSPSDRSNPHQTHPPRPAAPQKPSSNLPPQPQRGGNGQRATLIQPPVASVMANELSDPSFHEAEGAPTTPPGKLSLVPFPTASAPGPAAPKAVESEGQGKKGHTTGPGSLVIHRGVSKEGRVSAVGEGRAGSGRLGVEQSGRGREMVSVARRGSKSLPRDGRSRAEARAARQEADKVAALRYFAAEDRREREATRSSGAGSDGTRHHEHHEASPPSLPPAMLPPLEASLHDGDSKAWRVLGSVPHKVERRKLIKVSPSKVRSSSLPPRRIPAGTLNTTAEGDAGGGKGCVGGDGDRQLQSPPTRRGSRRRPRLHPPRPTPNGVGAIGSKKDPSVPTLSSYSNGDGRLPKRSIPLLDVFVDDDDGDGQPELEDLGPTAMTPRVAAAPLSPGIQTPPAHPVVDIMRLVVSPPVHAQSPPRPRPLSPGAQTPPGEFVDPRVEREATLVSTAVEVTTPRDLSRSRAKTMWANRSMEEAEAGAAEISPPAWGLPDEGSDRDRAGRLHSAASTPHGKQGGSAWGAGAAVGGGGGKRGLRGVVNRTPGRLPRRLHQGVNKVKRAVGVGEFQPTSSQVGPAGGTPETPKGKGSGFGSDGVRHVFLPSPARFRVRHREPTGGLGSARSSGSISSNGSTGSSNISRKQPALPPRSGRAVSGGGGKVAAAGTAALAASVGGGGGGGDGLSKIGSSGVKGGKSVIPVAADGTLSLREAHEKLEKLVKVLGPESRDEIWKALTKGAAPAASPSAAEAKAEAEEAVTPLERTGRGRSSSMATSTTPILNSPAVHCSGTRARRALSSSSSVGFEGCGEGPSPRERWGSDVASGAGGGNGVHVGWGGGGGGGTVVPGGGVKSAAKASKFAYRKRLRESLDAAYKNRGMVFCLQEAVLYVRGKDPICPDHRPQWWPDPGADGKPSPQIRAPLVGAWFEGRRAGAASLVPWQMRWNLFGGAGWNSGRGVAEDSKVRADGTRVPAMMVVPLEAVRERLPYFEEGVAVPISRVPRHAAVVWVSHFWMGTPSRPDDQDGSKAKAIYEGLRRLEYSEVYVWIDVSCLPSNVGPRAEKDKSSSLSRRQAVAEDVAASDSEVVRSETEEVREEMGQRARTIRALPLFLLCCDYFLAIDQREPTYMASPWTRLERAALREALALTTGGGATKASRNGHPKMLAMQREEMASFTSMDKRPTARIVQLSNLGVLPKLEPLPPFGQGSKAGASGISVADVPAMKRSFDLLKGLSMARRRLARYPFMDIPRLVPDEELGDEPIRAEGLVEEDFGTASTGGSYPGAEREVFEGGGGGGIGNTAVLQGQGRTGRMEREEPEGTTEVHKAGVEVAAAEMFMVETDGEELGVSAGLGAETGSPDLPGSRYRVERQPAGVSEEEKVTRGEGCQASIRGVSVSGIAAVGGSDGETEGGWISRDPRRCRRLVGAPNPSDSSSARIKGGEDGTRLVGGGVGIALRPPRFGGGIAEMSPVAVNAAAVAAATAQLSIIKRSSGKTNGSYERTRAATAAAVSEGLGVSADERTVEAITELTPVRRYGRRRSRRRRSRTWGTASEDDCAEPVEGIWSSSPSPQSSLDSLGGYGGVDGVAKVSGGSRVGGGNGIRVGGDGEGVGYGHDREGAVVVVEDERALGLDAGGVVGEVDFDGLPPLVTPTLREREMLISEGETNGIETPRKGKWDQGRPPPISRPSSFGSRAFVSSGLPSPQGGGAGGGFSKGGGGFGGSGGGSRVTARPPPSPSGASSRGGGAPPRRATLDGGSGGGRSSSRSRVSRAGFVAGIGGRDGGGEHPNPCNFLDIRNAFEIQANKTAASAVVIGAENGVGVKDGSGDEGAHGDFDRAVRRLSDSSSQRSR